MAYFSILHTIASVASVSAGIRRNKLGLRAKTEDEGGGGEKEMIPL